MPLRKYYTLKNAGKKAKQFWETFERIVKRESLEEVKTSEDEIRVYESNPLFALRSRVMMEKHDKNIELTIAVDSRKETMYQVIFGVIGLYMILGAVLYRSIYSIVSGLVGGVIYYVIVDYVIKTKEKEMVRSMRDYVEDSARKVDVEIE